MSALTPCERSAGWPQALDSLPPWLTNRGAGGRWGRPASVWAATDEQLWRWEIDPADESPAAVAERTRRARVRASLDTGLDTGLDTEVTR